jgi:hypothetical protein
MLIALTQEGSGGARRAAPVTPESLPQLLHRRITAAANAAAKVLRIMEAPG